MDEDGQDVGADSACKRLVEIVQSQQLLEYQADGLQLGLLQEDVLHNFGVPESLVGSLPHSHRQVHVQHLIGHPAILELGVAQLHQEDLELDDGDLG